SSDLNSLKRINEMGDVRSVMCIDDAHAAVLVNIVAAKQQIAHLETKLPLRMTRRVPDLKAEIAHLDRITLLELQVDPARRHGNLDSLRLDRRIGRYLVSAFNRFDALRMRGHLGLEQLLGAGNPLNVVGIRVRGHNHLARGQVEIHAPNQFNDFVHSFKKTDIDQNEFASAVDEIDIDSEPPTGLVIHLDDAG